MSFIYRGGNLLSTQENVWRHRLEVFHPVCLGDTFKDDRCDIRHKLGFGGSPTVLLATDRMHAILKSEIVLEHDDNYSRKQWVSTNIITADGTQHSHELRHLRSLACHSQGSIYSKYIVQLLDEFLHHGPNGNYQCLVLELLGPTVDFVVEDYQGHGDDLNLESDTILRMSEQLLQAIAFLHGAGYVHASMTAVYSYLISDSHNLSQRK